jgi:hypothetical protein
MRALALIAVLAGVARADDLDDIRAAAPACTATHCIGIHLHVASGDHALVATPDWVAERLAAANQHLATIDAGFTIAAIDTASAMHVATRADRNAIIGKGLHAGVIDVYLVMRLDDIDADGVIRGVTWRTKDDRKYIIMSILAPPRTLAHELGHFFGLPHSTYAISIMNKTPRDTPPPEQRRFADEEIAAMKPELKRLLHDKVIVEVTP